MPSKGGDRDTIGLLSSPNEVYSNKNWSHLIKLLDKEVSWEISTPPPKKKTNKQTAFAKSIGFSIN